MASRSLGVLTLDLVAQVGGFVQGMDKAERASAKWRKQVDQDLQTVKTASIAGLAAITAATAGMVTSQVKAATEVSQLATISAAGTTEFQRYAAAADTVGISQEKLSDQLKDFNEKLGEFQQSGGGGMKDFFEQIAPQIGITADAFKNLSGPQALQLYYDSLEKAGLSQQQMSFYLESMASDTTALIPLLRDGGAGFKLLGDEAERAGAVMDESTIAAADRMSAAIYLIEQSATGFRNQVSAELLPVLGNMAAELTKVSDEGAVADEVAGTLAFTVKGLAAAAVGAYGGVQLLGKGIAGLAVAGGALTKDAAWYERIIPPLLARRVYKNWDEAKAALSVVGEDLDETAQNYANILNSIWSADGSAGGGGAVDRLAELRRQAREFSAPGGSGSGVSSADPEAAKERDKALKQIEGQIQALEFEAETYGYTAAQIGLYKLELAGATEEQLLSAAAAYEVIEALDAQKEADEEAAERKKQALLTITELLPEQERETARLKEQQRLLNEAIKEFPELADAAAAALDTLEGELDGTAQAARDAAEQVENDMVEIRKKLMNNVQDSIADSLLGGFDEGAEGILKSFGDLLLELAAQAVAADLTQSLFSGAWSTGNTEALAGGVASLFGGFFADGGRPSANKISVVGERGPELFIPDGVTGTVIANDKIDMAALRQDRIQPTQVHIGQMNFPGVTNARQAEQSAGAAGRRINAAIAAAQRFS